MCTFLTVLMSRSGAELCSPHWDPSLFPQHLPPAGQARGGQLHPPEVRGGPRLLGGVRSSSHQDQQDLQNIQVGSMPFREVFWSRSESPVLK